MAGEKRKPCPELYGTSCRATKILHAQRKTEETEKGYRTTSIETPEFTGSYCAGAGESCRFYGCRQQDLMAIYEKLVGNGDFSELTDADKIDGGVLVSFNMDTDKYPIHVAKRGRWNGSKFETGVVQKYARFGDDYVLFFPVGIPFNVLGLCGCRKKHEVLKSGAIFYSLPQVGARTEIGIVVRPEKREAVIERIELGPITVVGLGERGPHTRTVNPDDEILLTNEEERMIESGTFNEADMNGAIDAAKLLQRAYREVRG